MQTKTNIQTQEIKEAPETLKPQDWNSSLVWEMESRVNGIISTNNISSSLEELRELEKTWKYVFHWSSIQISLIEPKQAFINIDWNQIPDWEPTVFATQHLDIAIFRSLINPYNLNFQYSSSFWISNGNLYFNCFVPISELPIGIIWRIYVIDKDDFTEFDEMQCKSNKTITPIKVVNVTINDLPNNYQIMEKWNFKKLKSLRQIQNTWSSYLWIENSDLLKKWIKVISHSKELLDSKEIYILKYNAWATIISVPEEIRLEIEKIIKESGQDNNKMHEAISRLYEWNKMNTGYILTNYLFDSAKINEINPNTRYISKDQKLLFDDFMTKCLDEDKKEVFMEFEEEFHKFYWYFENWELVAVANYVRNDENDKLAHIWIILRSDKKWMWYWKILANDITAEILNRNLIPQYRVAENNIASRRIAEKLWYEEILRWYSLRIR